MVQKTSSRHSKQARDLSELLWWMHHLPKLAFGFSAFCALNAAYSLLRFGELRPINLLLISPSPETGWVGVDWLLQQVWRLDGFFWGLLAVWPLIWLWSVADELYEKRFPR